MKKKQDYKVIEMKTKENFIEKSCIFIRCYGFFPEFLEIWELVVKAQTPN